MVDKIKAKIKDLYASKYDNDGAQLDNMRPYAYQNQSMYTIGNNTYPLSGYVMESNFFDELKNYLGTTTNWREVGFILPNGDLIDLSGKDAGGDTEKRNLQHKDISNFGYSLAEILDNGAMRVGYDGTTNTFVQFSIKNGFPTSTQWKLVDDLLSLPPYRVDIEVTPEGKDKDNPKTNFYKQYSLDDSIKNIKFDVVSFSKGDTSNIGIAPVTNNEPVKTKALNFANTTASMQGNGSNPQLTGIQPMWSLKQGGVVDLNETKLHDTLSDLLWDENKKLKTTIKNKLMAISELFRDTLKLYVPEDIYITGSFANYNYSDDKDTDGYYKSDIDLHLVYDFSKLGVDEDILVEYFKAKKDVFNSTYNFSIHKIPVEVGAENINTPICSTGVYSLTKDEWIKEPTNNAGKEIIDVDEEKYKRLTQQIEQTIETQDPEQIKAMIKTISKMRKTSLAADGEFGEGNLLFKKLRNDGYITRLKDVLSDLIGKELSLEMFYISRNYPETVIPTAPEIRKL